MKLASGMVSSGVPSSVSSERRLRCLLACCAPRHVPPVPHKVRKVTTHRKGLDDDTWLLNKSQRHKIQKLAFGADDETQHVDRELLVSLDFPEMDIAIRPLPSCVPWLKEQALQIFGLLKQ